MRILVGGSHGLIGTALVSRLQELDHSVVRLVRNDPEQDDILWQMTDDTVDIDAFEGFDAVINLAGRSIGEKRWRKSETKLIWNSRVLSTEFLTMRLAEVVNRPEVYIGASAVGYYGSRGRTSLDEESSRGEGFLADLCKEWEDSANPAREAGIRVVNLRSGIVLSPEGGVLKRQLPLFKLGIAGRLGSGEQFLPWIALTDEVNAIIHLLTHRRLSGPFNVTSPNPVTNVEFTATLGKVLGRPTFIPAWKWMLDLTFGRQLTQETLLASQRVMPKKLLDSGFKFKHPVLEPALEEMLARASDKTDDKKTGPDDKSAS